MSFPATAVITGASAGLGREMAIELARRGTRLALVARGEEGLRETARLCVAAGAVEPIIVTADVTRAEDCVRLVNESAAGLGTIDCLINNAGQSMWAPFESVDDPAIFQRLMAVNYLGPVWCAHASLPHLRRSGGMLVMIASVQSKIGAPYHTGYTAAKHALEGFTESLRMDLDGSGVGILTVYPSWISGTQLRHSSEGKNGNGSDKGSDAVSSMDCARRIVGAIERRATSLFIPRWMALLPFFRWAFPSLLRHFVLRKVKRYHE